MHSSLRAALASLLLFAACDAPLTPPATPPTPASGASERVATVANRVVVLRDPVTGAWTGPLATLKTTAEKQGHVRVIVGLRTPFVPEGDLPDQAARSAQRHGIVVVRDRIVRALAGTGSSVVGSFETIPYVSFSITPTGLTALAAQRDVTSLHEDVPVRATLTQSVPLIGGSLAWTAGYTGSGQAVAVLDSGVEGAHSFLTGKVIAEACYSTNDATYSASSLCPGSVAASTATGSGVACSVTINGCDHGTHVGGIAAGKGASFSGVAKDASVIAVQVFSKFTSSTYCGSISPCILSFSSDQIKGLDRVYALAQAGTVVSSVNMSLGGNASTTNCDSDPLKASIDNLRSVGVATVVASGNDGFTNSINAPACISTAISVGATTKADVVDSYSDSASFLSLLAPGTDINSSIIGGGYALFTGTSMAAPHVAGAWAILKQKKPTMTVTEGLSVLQSTGKAITDSRNNITKRRIKIETALTSLRAEPPTFTVTTGTYNTPQTVTVTSATSGATIWYTADGTTPINGTSPSIANGASLLVSGSATLKAIASKSTFLDSTVTSATYTLVALAPTFSPLPGEYGTAQTVTLSDASPGVTLRYTTNGTTPTAATPTTVVSGGTVAIASTTTLKALATRASWTDSGVTTGLYTITGAVSASLTPTGAVTQGARWRRTTASRDTFEEGNLGRFTYTRSGNALWTVTADSVADGQYAARAPTLTTGQTATLAATIECDGGPVTFSLRTSGASGTDFLRFRVDGVSQGSWSGATAWTTASFPVSAGTHTFAWEFSKGSGSPVGSDTVWVDGIGFPGDEWRATGTSAVGITDTSATVRFKDLPAWLTPADQTVTVTPGQTVAVSGAYVQRQVAAPTFSPIAGTYTTAQDVVIATTTPGATVRYTTDGSTPTASSTVYASPIHLPLDTTQTLKARAFVQDWLDSSVVTASYLITGTVSTPTFSPTPGTYTTAQSVTISSATANAALHYTTDGSTPTALSTIYSGPIAVPLDSSKTLRVLARRQDWVDSAIASATYVVTGTVATPTFAPAPGTYTTAQSVTLATTTPGAAIHFTTDGSTPTVSSPVYSVAIPVPLDSSKTVKAIATKANWVDSGVASGLWLVTGTVATPSISPSAGTYTTAQSITLATTTAGASIRYTTNGATPTASSTLYTGPFTVPLDTTQTVKALAIKTDWIDSGVATATFVITGTVATPTFSITPGTYTTAQTVTLATTTSGAAIHFTTDGSTPTAASPIYSAPISVPLDTTKTIRAVATRTDWVDSAVATGTFVITGTVATPTFSLTAGTYTTAQSVTLATTTVGASIRYTTNGATPTASSTLYTGPLTVPLDTTQTVKAIAIKTDWIDSGVATATFVITGTVATPTFSITPGTYTTAQSVTLATTTPGAAIHFTTDGSAPTAASPIYSAPIAVPLDTTKTIKALATRTDWVDSAVATGAFVITGTVATPTFSIAPGTYTTAQSVTLATTTPGAVMHFTTDGSTPTAVSPIYVAPISVPLDTTQTIKAVAIKTDWVDSGVATATFVITGTVATPTFSIAPGTYTTAQSVTLATTTAGASIRYTTNGATPTASSTLYTGPLTVPLDTTQTIQAVAIKTDWVDSGVATATFVITGTVATPTFSIAPGTYTTAQSVALATTTPGAAIHFTTDGSTPTAASPIYSAPISVALDTTKTIQAIATRADWADSAVATGAYDVTGTVATPTFSIAAGTYTTAQTVTLSTTTAGATLHFTTDGSLPDASSPVYTAALSLPLDTTTTLRAVAIKTSWTDSSVADATFTITGTVEAPTFSPIAGTYTAATDVSLTTATPGAVVHYTLDGTTPSASSPVFSAAIRVPLDTATTIRALATRTDWTDSDLVSATFTVTGQVATPVFSLVAGVFDTAQSLTITTPTPGATVRYTLDGTTPDESSPVASGPIPLGTGAIHQVRAAAWRTDWIPSDVASADYTVAEAFSLVLSVAGDGHVAPGAAVGLTILGGVGPFGVDPVANAAGEAADVQLDSPRDLTFTAPDVAAFAGLYDVVAHDTTQGLTDDLTLSVPPTIWLDTTTLLGGSGTLTVIVRGASPGATVSLEILDASGEPDAGGALASITAADLAADDAPDGNPAIFTVQAANVLDAAIFHLRATVAGQAALSADVSITPAARCGDAHVDAGEACDDGTNSGLPGQCAHDCSAIVPFVVDTGGDTDAGDTDLPADTDAGDTDVLADTDVADSDLGDTDLLADTDVAADTDVPTDNDTDRAVSPSDTDSDKPAGGCGCDQRGAPSSGGVALLIALVASRRRRALGRAA